MWYLVGADASMQHHVTISDLKELAYCVIAICIGTSEHQYVDLQQQMSHFISV